MRIYILCGDATYNRGDRGNLHSQVTLLRRKFPTAEIVVDSYRPEVDKNWYDATVVKRGTILSWTQVKWIAKSDVVVWGGGALLADNASKVKTIYWWFMMILIRLILRKPVMAWAQGLVLDTALGKSYARKALNLTDMISVRDDNSWKYLKSCGEIKVEHHQTMDPAILIEPADPERGRKILEKAGVPFDGRPIFAIANTFCAFHYNPNAIIPFFVAKPLGLVPDTDSDDRIVNLRKFLARISDRIITEYNARILFLPTYPAPWEDDPVHFAKTIDQIEQKEYVHILKEDTYAPVDYLAMWSFFDFFVTIPLHHSIFSTVMETPCLNLYYEPKGRDFFLKIGAGDRLLDVYTLFDDKGVDKVMERISYTKDNWSRLKEEMRAPVEELKVQARRNADLLESLLIRKQLIKQSTNSKGASQ